jgi:response regulator RpfG family c-di-GMP phosphodiesterase
MLSERPYRERLTKDQALSEIRAGAGSLYDPHIVTALEDVMKHIN